MQTSDTQSGARARAGWFKFILGWLTVFAVRLMPFRPPNVEPVMASMLPFAKAYGPLPGFLFGALSIAFYDVATHAVGVWTLTSALCYGAVGVVAHYLLRNRRGVLAYVATGIVGVLIYDLVTGVILTPLQFGGTFAEAAVGQVPFTVAHLLSTVALAFTLSPALERWVVRAPALEGPALLAKLGLARA